MRGQRSHWARDSEKFKVTKKLRQLQTRVHVNAGIITGILTRSNLCRIVQKSASSVFMQYRYKQGLERWISRNHGNHRNDENPGSPRCKPRISQTTCLEIPVSWLGVQTPSLFCVMSMDLFRQFSGDFRQSAWALFRQFRAISGQF